MAEAHHSKESMYDPVGPLTKKKLIGDHLVRSPLVYCTPVFIGELGTDESSLLANGTATLLQIDGRKFLVTADHVVRYYEECLLDNRGVAFQIGFEPFDPLSLVVDRSHEKDLCVLDASGVELRLDSSDTDLPKLEFYRAQTSNWPPKIVAEGDIVVFGGFPGSMRTQKGLEVTSSSFSVAAVPVTGSFSHYFTCNLDRSEWTSEHGPYDSAAEPQDWGGLSGGPALRDGKDILSPILSGFILEHEPKTDQIKMAHAALIRTDGRLERGRLI